MTVHPITCGSFTATQVRRMEWRFTCSRLPGWSHLVVAGERDAMTLLFQLQAEHRDLKEKK